MSPQNEAPNQNLDMFGQQEREKAVLTRSSSSSLLSNDEVFKDLIDMFQHSNSYSLMVVGKFSDSHSCLPGVFAGLCPESISSKSVTSPTIGYNIVSPNIPVSVTSP